MMLPIELTSTILYLLIPVAVSLCWVIYSGLFKHNLPLPPGPAGRPIVGNAKAVMQRQNWVKFSEWAQVYGDIFMLKVFGKRIVVLSNFGLAQDLFEKHGSTYSDRPRMVIINELFGLRSVTFLPYGSLWRKHRRMMHRYFNLRAVTSFQPQQTQRARNLLHALLHEPDNFRQHVQRFATATIVGLTYGSGIMSDQKYMDAVNTASVVFDLGGTPGLSILDLFPPLRYLPSFFPGCAVKKYVTHVRALLHDMSEHPFEIVKQQRDAGTAPPSLVTVMLNDYEQKHVTDMHMVQVMKEVAASLYRAGASTTDLALQTFFLTMALHPHVAEKAQHELDALLHGERLPEYDDRPHLPYLDCILKEVLRWNPPIPLGLPHRGTEDAEIAGKRIPKGALVVANIWHIMHDEATYANHASFYPDRFMQHPKLLNPASVVFGFGRRVCPGRHFADASLWLAIAHVLSVFDILSPLGKDGKPMEPALAYATGFNPTEFTCKVVARNEKAAALIARDGGADRQAE